MSAENSSHAITHDERLDFKGFLYKLLFDYYSSLLTLDVGDATKLVRGRLIFPRQVLLFLAAVGKLTSVRH